MKVWVWGPLSRMGLAVALAAAVIDQAFKFWMLFGFDIGIRGVVPVTPFFDLVLAWNYGVSYGLFPQRSPEGQWLLVGLKAAAVVLMWVWLARSHTRLAALALGLVIGGAIGNGIDRVLWGAVADFFSFHLTAYGIPFRWYVFNIADVAIVGGVALLLWDSLFGATKAPPSPGT